MLKYLPILALFITLLTANVVAAQSSNVTIIDKPKQEDKKTPPKDDKKVDKPKVKVKVVEKEKPIIKIKERVKIVHDPFKLSVDNLLLLNSQQLCILAGTTCSQNSFMTTSITTSLHSGTWTITGSVKNVGQETLKNIVATAILYDINGKTVGETSAATVKPSFIKAFDEGNFSMDIKGKNAVFLVLSYK